MRKQIVYRKDNQLSSIRVFTVVPLPKVKVAAGAEEQPKQSFASILWYIRQSYSLSIVTELK